MQFTIDGGARDLAVRSLTIAGWTGRSPEAVAHHIAELEAVGVAPPSETPLFYRAAREALTQAPEIDVLGPGTSGEAEPVLTMQGGALLLGLASDHTDRDLEAHSVAHSKAICAKPVAAELWPLDGVADADALALTCEVPEGEGWTPYQDGTLAGLLPLREIWERSGCGEGDWLLCGTVPAIGGIRASARYRMTLADPAGARAIRLGYAVRTLPVVA